MLPPELGIGGCAESPDPWIVFCPELRVLGGFRFLVVMKTTFLLKTAAVLCEGVLPFVPLRGERRREYGSGRVKLDQGPEGVDCACDADPRWGGEDEGWHAHLQEWGGDEGEGYDCSVEMGPTVEPSGAVTFADGKDMKLQEGQMVTLAARSRKAPSSIPDRGNLTGNGGENQ